MKHPHRKNELAIQINLFDPLTKYKGTMQRLVEIIDEDIEYGGLSIEQKEKLAQLRSDIITRLITF